MKIAIYSRGIENDQHKDMVILLEELKTHQVEPVFFQDFFNQFYSAVDMTEKYSTFNAAEDLDDSIDCVISLGGDGTLLDTVTFVQDKGIPVLGINYGRLGFLANIGKVVGEAGQLFVLSRESGFRYIKCWMHDVFPGF